MALSSNTTLKPFQDTAAYHHDATCHIHAHVTGASGSRTTSSPSRTRWAPMPSPPVLTISGPVDRTDTLRVGDLIRT